MTKLLDRLEAFQRKHCGVRFHSFLSGVTLVIAFVDLNHRHYFLAAFMFLVSSGGYWIAKGIQREERKELK